jgi:5-(carboxyamino)imidazole ribonucleotide mutase
MIKISKVAVVMGSISDLEVVKPCLETLEGFGIDTDVRIISAHRTPDEAHEFAKTARESGVEVIIGVAAKAAHLAGVLASFTTLPVIALPVSTKMMGGLDSLLSMVQMPRGVPVATVGIDAGENAGILAAQILSLKYPQLYDMLDDFKRNIALKVNNDNRNLQFKLDELRKQN